MSTATSAVNAAPAPQPDVPAVGETTRRPWWRRLVLEYVGFAGILYGLFTVGWLIDLLAAVLLRVSQSTSLPHPALSGWLVSAAVGGAIGVPALELLRWLTAGKKTAPYVFVSPFFIIFFTFGLFPILFSAYLSFHRWDPASGLGGIQPAGKGEGWTIWFDNYRAFLQLHFRTPKGISFTEHPWAWLSEAIDPEDPWFWLSLKNTFYIAVASGVPQHVVGMPLSYFFQIALKRTRNFISGVYFLPFITSAVAISLIFSTLFSRDFGVVNATLDSLHRLPLVGQLFPAEHINWMGKKETIRPAVSFVVWWRYVGWNTVLYLSALQAIPKDLFEAAEMDGASRWQTFRHVVLPLLAPMMFFAVTLTIIGNLQMFDVPYIILGPNGGAEQSGMTTAMYLYKTAFDYNDFGTACALAWALFLLIAALTWVNQGIFAKRGGMEGAE